MRLTALSHGGALCEWFGCRAGRAVALLTSEIVATSKRDSSTARPDPEIDKTDLREITRRDAPLRMTNAMSALGISAETPRGK